MLSIISGMLNTDRDNEFNCRIKKAVDEGRSVLVIVPDQYSFESDKKLYEFLGALCFNRIETAGFNRLAELIMRASGKTDKRSAAENTRIIMMYKAVMRFRTEKDAHYYRSSLEKSRFLTEMLNLIAELIRCGIAPDDLLSASIRVEGSLSLKLYDISRLYKYYLDFMSEVGLRDSLSAISDALSLAEDSRYFDNKAVFFDGFTNFSVDEYNMIRCMLRQGADVTVSLLCSDLPEDIAVQTFAVTLRTRTNLLRIANELNAGTEKKSLDKITASSQIVSELEKYYSSSKEKPIDDPDGLTILAANDIYDETEYICSEIQRLVREDDLNYSDIAVSARQLGTAAPVIEGVFERYEIPFFIDRRVSAESSVIVLYLKSLFECLLTKEYRTTNIFRFLRSPLCPMLDIDITDLEDYCITYNVDRSMWLEPFGESVKCSSKLEKLRRSIIEPFEQFKMASSDSTASELCTAFFELLEKSDLSRQVYSVVKRASGSANEMQIEFARANKQLWQSILGAFGSIYEDLGDEKLSLRRFYDLFKLMASRMSVSSPPQKLDAVRCVDSESSRFDNVRAMFIIDANDGIFPASPENGGLFTEREKQLLADLDLPLQDTALARVENERLVVYQNLCVTKDKLYVLYSTTDGKGKLRSPSEIISMLTSSFKGISVKNVADMPISFFCSSYQTAYYKLLEFSKEKLVKVDSPNISSTERSDSIRKSTEKADTLVSVEKALMNDDIYASKLKAFDSYAENIDYRISKKTSIELFCKNGLTLSPSRINDYYSCPFSFFAGSGLKLRAPSKITLNQLQKGNYLHRCLESIMTKNENGTVTYNKAFVVYTDDQLKEMIHSAFLKYEAEEIGGEYGKTSSFQKEKELYEETVFRNIKLIQTEFSNSAFEPAFFEYKLIKENNECLLKIKVSDDLTVNIAGTVDRADVFKDTDGKKYLRIVDYKTGKTQFQLEAIYHGLNLQLLIYLLALTSGEFIPAGVMYSHIVEASAQILPDEQTDEKTELQRLKAYKPDGMIVGQDNILKALCTEKAGAFTPFGFTAKNEIKKSGRQPVTLAFLKASEEYAKRKITALAEKLIEGSVPASPVVSGKKDPCSYCDYYAVCGRMHHGEPTRVLASDKEKCIEEINRLADKMKGDDNNA